MRRESRLSTASHRRGSNMVGRKTWPMPRRARSMVRSRPTAPGRPRPPWHECGVGPRRHEGCFREAQRHCSREAQRPGAGDSVPCGRRAVTRGSMPRGAERAGLPCGSDTADALGARPGAEARPPLRVAYDRIISRRCEGRCPNLTQRPLWSPSGQHETALFRGSVERV